MEPFFFKIRVVDRGIMSLWRTTFLITDILLTLSAKECNRLNTTCCYNEYFDTSTGKCKVCRHGSIGWNCESPCTTGYYGYLCSTPCECDAYLCDKKTGCQSPQNETSNDVSEDAKKDNGWIVVSLSIMVFIVVSVICAIVLYFRRIIKRFLKRSSIVCLGRDAKESQECAIVQQQDCVPVEIVDNEDDLSPDYDDIRYSQCIRSSIHCGDLPPSGDKTIENNVDAKLPHFVGFDNANKKVGDYSRLLLRKNNDKCILMKTAILEDEDYAFLQTNDNKETTAGSSIQESQFLSKISTINENDSVGTNV